MVRCNKCKLEKEEDQFNFKNKKLNLRSKVCKACTRKAIKDHYQRNRSYYLSKANKRNEKQKKEQQELLLEFLSKNPCIDCGESDPIVLEFDHIENKFENVSVMVKSRFSTKKLLEEIKKCEIRCANCHRRKTARDFNWYRHKMHS